MGSSMLMIVALLGIFAPQPEATVSVADKFPVQGTPTVVTVTPGATHLCFTTQPGAKAPVSTETTVSLAGKSEYTWTPDRAGIYRIEALDGDKSSASSSVLATTKVSVKFDGIPMSGLLIFILAGSLLFGGAIISLKTLLSEDDDA